MNAKYPMFYNSKQFKTKEQKEKDQFTAVGLLTVAIAVLVDRFGFTEDDAERFSADYMELIGSINDRKDNLQDIAKQLKEIYGIEVKGK